MKIAEQEVTLLKRMGDDLSVVNAARVSFDKESSWSFDYEKDESELPTADTKLIAYLAKHNHWSPFSHAFASFRIKAPLFVARQLGKHQVGLAWNEVSRRYVDSEPEFFLPTYWREKADSVKQGSSEAKVGEFKAFDAYGDKYDTTPESAAEWAAEVCLNTYKNLLTAGVCPEQARMILPQNTMTEWIWSGSLYAFARVCNLRLDSHTQRETQEVVREIYKHLRELFPVSVAALVKDEHGA